MTTTTKELAATLTIRARGDEPSITITTPTVDYMGDSVDPMGIDTSRYLAGPRAVNFAHDHSRLPVAKTLTLARSAEGVRATFAWLDHPDAQEVRGVFEAGALGASIEFIPVGDPVAKRDGGYRFAKSILTGWALTGNPANPECVRMLKSLGLRRSAADEIDVSMLSRADVLVALREGIGALAQDQATAAVTRERWKLIGAGEHVLILDDEIEAGLTPGDVKAAFREALGPMVVEQVAAALRRARGRVD